MKVAMVKKVIEVVEVPDEFFEKYDPPHNYRGVSQWILTDRGYAYYEDENLLRIEEVDTENIIAEW